MLTLEELDRNLDYNPITGILTWVIAKKKTQIGSIAGHVQKDGRRRIKLNGVCYLAHRLAWFSNYGEWPNGEIDHIDRNPDNNAISNLRIVTKSQNQWNTGIQKNNKSGFKGVYFHARDKKFIASATNFGKVNYIGRFDSAEEASEAYLAFIEKTRDSF